MEKNKKKINKLLILIIVLIFIGLLVIIIYNLQKQKEINYIGGGNGIDTVQKSISSLGEE